MSFEPKRPPFTTRGLLDYIVELIVCEDEACVYMSLISQRLTASLLGVSTDRAGELPSTYQVLPAWSY